MEHISCDTLIIGAGAAGLAAGKALLDAGQNFLIVEARDRVGGRVWTLHDPNWPLPIECGAEFIHGQPKSTLDLMEAANVPYYDMADTHWHFDGRELKQRDDFWEMIEQIDAKLEADKAHDRTFKEFIDRSNLPAQTKSLAIKYVEGFDAADHQQVGTEWVRRANAAEEALGEGMMRIPAGYDSLIRYMRSQLDSQLLRLNTVVKSINWKHGSVTTYVESIGERLSIQSRRVLITLPLGVLQAPFGADGAVRFDPPLAAKQDALSKLGMGGVVKVVLHFKTRWWESIDPQINFMHDATNLPIPTWWAQLPMHAPVLTGWVGGPNAAKLSGQPTPDILDAGLMSLATITERGISELRDLLLGWHVHDWLADPYARGAYSYGLVGGSQSAADLAKPIADTLFFAGEATGGGMVGTVATAIETGRRAAAEIIALTTASDIRRPV